MVFDPEKAVEIALRHEHEREKAHEQVILVRTETAPEDFHGMVAAQAIVTARGHS